MAIVAVQVWRLHAAQAPGPLAHEASNMLRNQAAVEQFGPDRPKHAIAQIPQGMTRHTVCVVKSPTPRRRPRRHNHDAQETDLLALCLAHDRP